MIIIRSAVTSPEDVCGTSMSPFDDSLPTDSMNGSVHSSLPPMTRRLQSAREQIEGCRRARQDHDDLETNGTSCSSTAPSSRENGYASLRPAKSGTSNVSRKKGYSCRCAMGVCLAFSSVVSIGLMATLTMWDHHRGVLESKKAQTPLTKLSKAVTRTSHVTRLRNVSFPKLVKPVAAKVAQSKQPEASGLSGMISGAFAKEGEKLKEYLGLSKSAAQVREERRKQLGKDYARTVGAHRLTEIHSWANERELRHALHCDGLLEDRTDFIKCEFTKIQEASAIANVWKKNQRCGKKEPPAFPPPFVKSDKDVDDNACVAGGAQGLPQCFSSADSSVSDTAKSLLRQTHSAGSNSAESPWENCPTCAVVGSSGNILDLGLGSEIDEHDVVLRFTCNPIEGFAEDVGKKTTHRMFYPEASWFAGEHDDSCENLVRWMEEGTALLAIPFKPADVRWWNSVLTGQAITDDSFWKPVAHRLSLPPERVALVSPRWFQQTMADVRQTPVNSEWDQNAWVSTGLFGVLLAIQNCRKIRTYGFGPNTKTGEALGTNLNTYYLATSAVKPQLKKVQPPPEPAPGQCLTRGGHLSTCKDAKSPCCSSGACMAASLETCECPTCLDYRWNSQLWKKERVVGVVIPYRDREKHWAEFKAHWQNFSKNPLNSHITWYIAVVEQFDSDLFNRGWLFNVGYRLLSDGKLIKGPVPDCLAIHDVDMYPESGVDYGFCQVPQQLSSELDRFSWSVPYKQYTGGVVSMSREHWAEVNGFSNGYAGWGAEDDDLFIRLGETRFLVIEGGCTGSEREGETCQPIFQHIWRPPQGHGRMTTPDEKEHTPRVKPTGAAEENQKKLLKGARERQWVDGISHLDFKLVHSRVEEAGPKIQVLWAAVQTKIPGAKELGPPVVDLRWPEEWCTSPSDGGSLVEKMGCSSCLTAEYFRGVADLREAVWSIIKERPGCRPAEDPEKWHLTLLDIDEMMARVVPTEDDLASNSDHGLSDDDMAVRQWVRERYKRRGGAVMVTRQGVPKDGRRFVRLTTTCAGFAGDSQITSIKKHQVEVGNVMCSEMGWSHAHRFEMVRFSHKADIDPKDLVSICTAINEPPTVYRIGLGEDCSGTIGGLEWRHHAVMYTSKKAQGERYCVGYRATPPVRWKIEKAADCTEGGDGQFAHSFSFRAMKQELRFPLTFILGCGGHVSWGDSGMKAPASCEAFGETVRIAGLSSPSTDPKVQPVRPYCVGEGWIKGESQRRVAQQENCGGSDGASSISWTHRMTFYLSDTAGKGSQFCVGRRAQGRKEGGIVTCHGHGCGQWEFTLRAMKTPHTALVPSPCAKDGFEHVFAATSLMDDPGSHHDLFTYLHV